MLFLYHLIQRGTQEYQDACAVWQLYQEKKKEMTTSDDAGDDDDYMSEAAESSIEEDAEEEEEEREEEEEEEEEEEGEVPEENENRAESTKRPTFKLVCDFCAVQRLLTRFLT